MPEIRPTTVATPVTYAIGLRPLGSRLLRDETRLPVRLAAAPRLGGAPLTACAE